MDRICNNCSKRMSNNEFARVESKIPFLSFISFFNWDYVNYYHQDCRGKE